MVLSPERTGRITGSKIGNILRIGYDSIAKMFRIITGLEKEEIKEHPALQWGVDNEVNALLKFQALTGQFVIHALDNQPFLKHPKFDWIGVTPDGITLCAKALIELKCPYSREIPDDPNDQPQYIAQIQYAMWIAKAIVESKNEDSKKYFHDTFTEECYLTYWKQDQCVVFRIPFCQEYIDQTFPKILEFWECVQNKEPPKRAKKPTYMKVQYEVMKDDRKKE